MMTDGMPKLFDIYGDKTHTALSKKSNSSMKFEQMVLALALAYFHDAIVFEETTLDLLQDLPASEHTPFLNDLWDQMLRAHNTKKGVYGMLCNHCTMISYRALLDGDSEAHGGPEAVRASLLFMEQKAYVGTEGMVADSVLTKWMAEFDSSKQKAVMTTTTKQAAGAQNRAVRSDSRVGGGRGAERSPHQNSPEGSGDQDPVSTRNEKNGHWEPTQLVEHLELEVDFEEGLFRVTEKAIEEDPLQGHGVALQRLYLRELYFVLGKKKNWGSKARYIRSKVNKWADRLSRDKDLEHWRINERWFKYAEEQWIKHSLDRFASEISAQLPRYYSAAWHDPSCEGVDSLTYDWRKEHNWIKKMLIKEIDEVRPGGKIEIFWPEDDEWYHGTVVATGEDGRAKIEYDDGDEEHVFSSSLKEERYRVPPSETTEDEQEPQQEEKPTPWRTALLQHWTGELGDNQFSETATEMQATALQKSTVDNYERPWGTFERFCTREKLEWLPTTAATAQLYLAAMKE
ncbi:hypothetical protein CYMTET_54386 [Cymbomonas tetramitiformis]|uniref:Core-binding (CB) domain-containing protein n=1 Tax=Cymbomonas tetramitiformis TaxID=36881 RepID=A0AAE0EQS5_9CHLO|nr:hypothetical protein CYMTET_54386 [Cymbomonas tetramitiformis]